MSENGAAAEIVSASTDRLCLDMRFLATAILSLEKEVLEGNGKPGCDGSRIEFHSATVVSDYRSDRNSVARQIAHCVLHCLLGHVDPQGDRSLSLAQDMIVEYVIDSMDTPNTSVPGRDDRLYACEKFFKRAGSPSPDLLRNVLSDISDWQFSLYTGMFSRDDNSMLPKEDDGRWKQLSLQAMTEAEGFITKGECATDGLLAILRIRNRRRYDYRSFLRRFMTRKSDIRENIDEFDPIYYSYGLRTYGNVPLIDSVESSDSRTVDEFVIAIDTSGSTMRGPVIAFLEEAYAVLRQCNIGRGAELHIIQCDEEVRSDDIIGSEADLRSLISHFKLRGGKGTDFRPVFRYIDDLMKEGKLKNLRGLMYFTDGRGIYPEKRPPYDTAFVFCDDSCDDRDVPPWAMKLVIGRSDLMKEGTK